MQIQAVEIEMRLYLAQEEKDSPNYNKGASIKPAKKAVGDLNIIKTNLTALSLPPVINELKPQFTGVVDKLIGIYAAVAKKAKIDQDKEFKEFWDMVDAYNKNLKLKVDLYIKVPQGLKEFDILGHESKLFTKPEDSDKFLKADTLITKEKKYSEAAPILQDLLTRYKDSLAEGSIVSRLADCAEMGGDEVYKELGDPEYVLKLLDDFISKNKYSPIIQRIYLQWRTLKQTFENGLSNWSGIPNYKYIEALWGVKGGIEAYITSNPNDDWAKIQLLLLMDMRLIERWRSDYQFGSSVAIDHYNLWGLENAP
jgi:hypothetical protein